eukprot:GILI01011647.1.p1 GENE.GILI01011647.1~~GILI01011647.1.p1  ORF type:complete len:705 (+),score=164.69 GILI01011647.1:93-2207(+)
MSSKSVSFSVGDAPEEKKIESLEGQVNGEESPANANIENTTEEKPARLLKSPVIEKPTGATGVEPVEAPATPEPKKPAEDKKSKLKLSSNAKVKTVYCDDCKCEIPIDEWPNHRDRLRSVVVVERLSKIQNYIKTLIVDLVMWLLVNVYFRDVAVCGLENVPKTGPVVFYGNHQNQFIDAMVMRAFCGRQVRFIIAEKSVHRPIIGHFARMMDAVPVVRPQDVGSTQGQGKLVSTDGSCVTGEGTNFVTALARGDVISWAVPGKKERCSGQILSIKSDTVLTLTLAVDAEDSVKVPTAFKYSRRIDHSEMYAKVYTTLEQGHCIGIFPEGGSHDRTSLLPLKAGVALFSLGAAERGIVPTIIPCGLTYFYGHKFRSRAHIEFGEPIRPDEATVEGFKEPEHKREKTGEMLAVLDGALRSVTINVNDWATLKFLHAFRRLYQPAGLQLDTKDYLRLTRRLSLIITEHGEEPAFEDFRTKVESYNDYCSALLIRDSQAATLAKLGDSSFQLLARRILMIGIMGVVLFPFFLVALPIGLITHTAAEAHAKTALSASSVKVVAADVKGSYKLVVGFAVVPVVMNVVSLIVYFLSDARTALTIWFSLPMAMYVSLVIMQEFVLEVYAALPLVVSIFSKHKQFRKLHERRQTLVEVAQQMVNTFDPELQTEMANVIGDEDSAAAAAREPSLFSLRHSSRKPELRSFSKSK